VNQTGVLGSPAKRCEGNSFSFECCAFRSWRMNRPGGRPRLETGWALTALRVGTVILCHLRPVHTGPGAVEDETAMEAVPGSNPGERPGRRGSVPPSSALEGAPPARQRALNSRDGSAAVRLDTSIFLLRARPSWLKGPL
jgi:hypothetical protein